MNAELICTLKAMKLSVVFTVLCLASTGSGQAKNNRRCISPDGSYGWCTHLTRCPLPDFKKDKLKFMDYFCIIERLYIGVCCPDKFLFNSQVGTTIIGNPAHTGVGHIVVVEGTELLPVEDNNVPQFPPTKKPPAPPIDTTVRRGCGLNEKMDVARVTGGKIADAKQWPWMVALMKDFEIQFCGGCLITDQHVLTAAHCLRGYKPADIFVRLGEHDFTRLNETRAQDIKVSEIRRHQDFDDVTYENDISVLKLSRTATFNSYVWPACLPEVNTLFTGQTAFVIGWGTVEYGGPVSEKLQEVSVPVWDNEECQAHYIQSIRDTNLCAGGRRGEDSCQGDSGGPLLIQLDNRRWVTIGVVSWGIKCGEERPAVYTRVNRYVDWIVRNTF